ncbi:MAG: Dabb family protein [Bacteroidales bacterium]
MQRRNFLKNSGIAAFAGTAMIVPGCTPGNPKLLGATQIQHGVIFSLKHEKGSPEALKFLEDGRRILSGIPVVQQFQAFDQVSPKNDYEYGFSMVFDGMDAYEEYNEHPDHVDFVENRWKKEVTEFLEIDFRTHKGQEV